MTRVAAWTFLGAPWWVSLLGCCVLGWAIGRVWPDRWLP